MIDKALRLGYWVIGTGKGSQCCWTSHLIRGGPYWKDMFLPFCIRQKFSKLDWARVSAVRYSIVLSLTLDWILEVVQALGRSTRKPDSHLLNFPCIPEKLPDLISLEVLCIKRKRNKLSSLEMGPSLIPWLYYYYYFFGSDALRKTK